MTAFEIYVFVLCLIVFVLLTAVFATMIVVIARLSLKHVRAGLDDQEIWKEYLKTRKKKQKKTGIAEILFSVVFYTLLFLVFAFSVYTKATEHKKVGERGGVFVVQSDSMSDRYEKNAYLFQNNLKNQFDTFDVIITHKLPKEEDLKLYDIVVYEVEGDLVVHRIVGIEEPNAKHPNERYFRLQGDNVHVADKFPVKYSQMRSIYRGEKIRFVGSFISFMQSPAGYMCMLLLVTGVIALPIVEKKLEEEREKRIAFILKNKVEELRRKRAQKTAKKVPVKPEKNAKTKVRDIPLNATLPPVYPVLLPPLPPMAIPVAVVQIKACEKEKEEKDERVQSEVIECDE